MSLMCCCIFLLDHVYSVRQGATEMHNIAAYLGGVGAQEALKIIIKQYVPLNNTLIFNGIFCSSSSLSL